MARTKIILPLVKQVSFFFLFTVALKTIINHGTYVEFISYFFSLEANVLNKKQRMLLQTESNSKEMQLNISVQPEEHA